MSVDSFCFFVYEGRMFLQNVRFVNVKCNDNEKKMDFVDLNFFWFLKHVDYLVNQKGLLRLKKTRLLPGF